MHERQVPGIPSNSLCAPALWHNTESGVLQLSALYLDSRVAVAVEEDISDLPTAPQVQGLQVVGIASCFAAMHARVPGVLCCHSRTPLWLMCLVLKSRCVPVSVRDKRPAVRVRAAVAGCCTCAELCCRVCARVRARVHQQARRCDLRRSRRRASQEYVRRGKVPQKVWPACFVARVPRSLQL